MDDETDSWLEKDSPRVRSRTLISARKERMGKDRVGRRRPSQRGEWSVEGRTEGNDGRPQKKS